MMDERIFLDKDIMPSDEMIKNEFGDLFSYYQAIESLTGNYNKKWNYYKSSGWILKHYDKKKALFYLIPLRNQIKIGLTLRETEIAPIMEKSVIDESIRDKIREAKKYPEGYAIEMIILDDGEYAIFENFINTLINIRTNK